MSSETMAPETPKVSWWEPTLVAALAGGMAWGIRGQYGHETGAMMAGLLISLVVAFLLCPAAVRSMNVARAIAMSTLAMGIGGSMTYGQTLGLTHDPDLVGNQSALAWGLLGCAIKGSVWIGFCGLFMGMGFSKTKYHPIEMLLFMIGLILLFLIGIAALNLPFDVENRNLPRFYFSGDWYWQPDKVDLKPRFEVWGGLWFALIGGMAYTRFRKGDRLAFRLGLWGLLGGALGFPGGQCIQAYHAWNLDQFTDGIWERLPPINWWNMMETTFGTIAGAALGFGSWLNRNLLTPAEYSEEETTPLPVELGLLVVHIPLLVCVVFVAIPAVDFLYDYGLPMILIPMVACVRGRIWPYLQVMPLILIPIAGKTLRELAYKHEVISMGAGWVIYLIVPLLIFLAAALYFYRRAEEGQAARPFTRSTLLLAAWMFFLLNFAFFRFPWPWSEWTGRTPNAIIYTVQIAVITGFAVMRHRNEGQTEPQST